MGDSQAALFAQHGFAPGAAKVTFGTGSSILLNIGPAPRFPGEGVATALAWQLGAQPTYAFEGIIISAASTLTWLRDQLGFVQDIAEFETLASAVPDNGGVYLVPAFSGLGLPHWAPAARAALVGLGTQSNRRHVARAALESIPLQIRDALESLRSGAGVNVAEIHADGGPTANRLLMQLTADLTGATLRVAAMPHCSPLGAAYAGLLGSGHYRSPGEISALPRDETVYRPAMTATASARLINGWHGAVRSVLGGTR
jgi:glycerol kinase